MNHERSDFVELQKAIERFEAASRRRRLIAAEPVRRSRQQHVRWQRLPLAAIAVVLLSSLAVGWVIVLERAESPAVEVSARAEPGDQVSTASTGRQQAGYRQEMSADQIAPERSRQSTDSEPLLAVSTEPVDLLPTREPSRLIPHPPGEAERSRVGEMQDWMANGHNPQGDVVPLWDLPTLAGAGARRSTVGDMLAFLAANIGSPESQLERAMRASHEIRESAGPQMSIGLNWHVRSVGDEKIVWHNGGTAGFRTFIGFDPDAAAGVVVLTNSGHGADDIGFHLINPGLPLAPAPARPRERVEVEVAEDILETYVGEYEFAPTFSIVVTLEAGALFAQATGQPKFPIFAESETQFFLRVVDAQVSFTMDDSGAVTGIILHQGGANQPGRKID